MKDSDTSAVGARPKKDDDSDVPVSVREAARALGCHEATLRQWVRDGAPCERPGAVGRGHGARVRVSAIRRWRGRRWNCGESDGFDVLAVVAESLLESYQREENHGQPAHVLMDIHSRDAAGYLVAVYGRLYRKIRGQQLGQHGELPEPILQLYRLSAGESERKGAI